jgi:hypothetical protein
MPIPLSHGNASGLTSNCSGTGLTAGSCGGIITVLQTDLIIRDNFFDNNNALTAAGLGVFGAGRITKNHFQKHQGQDTVHLGTYQGIFENNTVVGNNTNTGIKMDFSGNSPFPRLSNNIIAESGINAILAPGWGRGLRREISRTLG